MQHCPHRTHADCCFCLATNRCPQPCILGFTISPPCLTLRLPGTVPSLTFAPATLCCSVDDPDQLFVGWVNKLEQGRKVPAVEVQFRDDGSKYW